MAANAARPIPPHNAEAEKVEDAYPLHNVIPSAEWKAINTSAFDEAVEYEDKRALLPNSNSTWVNHHLKSHEKQQDQKKKRDLL